MADARELSGAWRPAARYGAATMRLHHIHVQRDFTQPVERVFAYLAEHENLGAIFKPLRVERVRDGQSARNGVGSTPDSASSASRRSTRR